MEASGSLRSRKGQDIAAAYGIARAACVCGRKGAGGGAGGFTSCWQFDRDAGSGATKWQESMMQPRDLSPPPLLSSPLAAPVRTVEKQRRAMVRLLDREGTHGASRPSCRGGQERAETETNTPSARHRHRHEHVVPNPPRWTGMDCLGRVGVRAHSGGNTGGGEGREERGGGGGARAASGAGGARARRSAAPPDAQRQRLVRSTRMHIARTPLSDCSFGERSLSRHNNCLVALIERASPHDCKSPDTRASLLFVRHARARPLGARAEATLNRYADSVHAHPLGARTEAAAAITRTADGVHARAPASAAAAAARHRGRRRRSARGGWTRVGRRRRSKQQQQQQ